MNPIKFLLPLVALLLLCACGKDDAMEKLENSDQIIRFKIDGKQYEATGFDTKSNFFYATLTSGKVLDNISISTNIYDDSLYNGFTLFFSNIKNLSIQQKYETIDGEEDDENDVLLIVGDETVGEVEYDYANSYENTSASIQFDKVDAVDGGRLVGSFSAVLYSKGLNQYIEVTDGTFNLNFPE